MRFCIALIVMLLIGGAAFGQPLPAENGPKRVNPGWHALMHATVIPAPGQVVEDATIVIRDGFIERIESGGAAPAGAREWDCTGLMIYPGLIDPFVEVDAPAPTMDSPGRHWNALVMPERHVLDGDGLGASARESLRKSGVTVAQLAPKGGLFRGSTAVISLEDEDSPAEASATVLRERVFQVAALETQRGRDSGYPGSKMGAIALMRQTLSDAAWYRESLGAAIENPTRFARPEHSAALTSLNRPMPLLFDVGDELDVLRVEKIAAEFDRPFAIVGSGLEFRRLDAIARNSPSMIIPLAYPDKPLVEKLADREDVALRELMTWEQAPTNLRRLETADVRVALTMSKLPKGQKFFDNLREAIKHGLSEERALAMLTIQPARMLGLEELIGTIEVGKMANLVVVDGALFDKKREIRDVWIRGLRHEINAAPEEDYIGDWTVELALATPVEGTLTVGEKNAISFKTAAMAAEQADDAAEEDNDAESDAEDDVAGEGQQKKAKPAKARNVSRLENRLNFMLEGEPFEVEGLVLMAAIVEGHLMHGTGELASGERFAWSARRVALTDDPAEEEDGEESDADGEEDEQAAPSVPEEYGYPLGAYGILNAPEQPLLFVTGATIWTCGPDGIIEDGAMLIRHGRIMSIGPADALGAAPAGAVVIDASGRHISPGIIDCHSHTGISGGVNEGTQAVTAEVRIFDVISPDDIDWYRQLAGGVTAANQLHGSANPIGGQNSVVKLRWGAKHPDGMRFEGASPGIKFALGENVKQSNWGDNFRSRYPQSRMGVETIIRDRFIAAQEYMKERESRSGTGLRYYEPRRDLELEALAEILRGERLVHCHSYRQDEILMLCRVAADFGFTIGTFQHVLEGYKVAEAIREHALGGSSFSDWWAYKFEVYDAIPYNGAIMHDAGVTVSFNSDSDELARRLNVEAAKAVKYGGIDPHEALKFVTLNPAKQLRIADRVGSLEAGKDADFVIWSSAPLSTLARCEATYIDGREYFSIARDAELRRQALAERTRIIQKLLGAEDLEVAGRDGEAEDTGGIGRDVIDSPRPTGIDHLRAGADDHGHEHETDIRAYYEWMIRNGFDPEQSMPGVCGCGAQGALSHGH